MTSLDVRSVTGDLRRFAGLSDRVEVLLDSQERRWTARAGNWLVVPVDRRPPGFYLLSEDVEGQRRGREVLGAFLGPATATMESMTLSPEVDPADLVLSGLGLDHVTYIRRRPGNSADDMFERLEAAVMTALDRDVAHRMPVVISHVDLLRDFRLALLRRDGSQAEHALTQLRSTGQLSAENLRFLTVEKLGRLERWRELGRLPYLGEMLRARRPRAINELLLDMLWHTGVAERCAAAESPDEIWESTGLGSRFGALVGSVDVPVSAAGRAVAMVGALKQGDQDRVERLLSAAANDSERQLLRRIGTGPQPVSSTRPVGESTLLLLEDGQFRSAVAAFLNAPTVDDLDAAVQAVLDSSDDTNAGEVLAYAERFVAEGLVQPDRRFSRDLEDLRRLVDNTVTSWRHWTRRVAAPRRWSEAHDILRSQSPAWRPVAGYDPVEAAEAADALLEAWTGTNQDQVRLALDLLCRAASSASGTSAGGFADAVLLVLGEQDNLSAPVRDAYLDLLDRLLAAAPTRDRYRDYVQGAAKIWNLIASPSATDWGVSIVDILQEAPAPDDDIRLVVTAAIVSRARDFGHRLTRRQHIELEILAAELSLPARAPSGSVESDEAHWQLLDGKVVGLYSLLAHASAKLGKRLDQLSTNCEVQGNDDTVASPALRALAMKADYLIVDTWHAAHAATQAIDKVRPRERQILPAGRGVTAFVHALEVALLAILKECP
jgi:hypothetical protein